LFKKIQHIHFIGIGGSGMSGIAEVLLNLGYRVSGSDMKETPVTRRLAQLGASISIGHDAKNIGQAHVVVTSTAVSAENPEVIAAVKAAIPVIPRIEMLAELARLKYTIAVAGTHGKTTTTSMVAAILDAGALDPTVIVGGRLKHLDSGAHVGKGDYLVAEADESDGSFLKLSPTLSIITNIDNDHLDYYGTFENIGKAFVQFANHIPFYGCVIVCMDDAEIQKRLPQMKRRVITYGTQSTAVCHAEKIQISLEETQFDVIYETQHLGRVSLKVPGRHNVLNALASIVVGLELGISWNAIVKGLGSFEGVGRRLEIKGERDGVLVIDDYGHHPTEIQATLSALKERYPERRLVALFQPHRYSRTQSLYKEFANSFTKANIFCLLDIYPAGEKPLPGVTSDLIANATARSNNGIYRWNPSQVEEGLVSLLKSGDILLTLGAGDVWKLGEQWLAHPSPMR